MSMHPDNAKRYRLASDTAGLPRMQYDPNGPYVDYNDFRCVVETFRKMVSRLQSSADPRVMTLLESYRRRCLNSPDGYGDMSCGFDRTLDCGENASWDEITKAKEVASRCCERCAEYDELFSKGI